MTDDEDVDDDTKVQGGDIPCAAFHAGVSRDVPDIWFVNIRRQDHTVILMI